jgi:hypothetical protein
MKYMTSQKFLHGPPYARMPSWFSWVCRSLADQYSYGLQLIARVLVISLLDSNQSRGFVLEDIVGKDY